MPLLPQLRYSVGDQVVVAEPFPHSAHDENGTQNRKWADIGVQGEVTEIDDEGVILHLYDARQPEVNYDNAHILWDQLHLIRPAGRTGLAARRRRKRRKYRKGGRFVITTGFKIRLHDGTIIGYVEKNRLGGQDRWLGFDSEDTMYSPRMGDDMMDTAATRVFNEWVRRNGESPARTATLFAQARKPRQRPAPPAPPEPSVARVRACVTLFKDQGIANRRAWAMCHRMEAGSRLRPDGTYITSEEYATGQRAPVAFSEIGVSAGAFGSSDDLFGSSRDSFGSSTFGYSETSYGQAAEMPEPEVIGGSDLIGGSDTVGESLSETEADRKVARPLPALPPARMPSRSSRSSQTGRAMAMRDYEAAERRIYAGRPRPGDRDLLEALERRYPGLAAAIHTKRKK